MLRSFILANRDRIIERARQRVQVRTAKGVAEGKLGHGIPLFLTQLVDALESRSAGTLHMVQAADTTRSIGGSASLHGEDLLRDGFTVAQVVHGYGDVCQIVTELASEANAAISAEDFHVFNRCLDDAIAGAVTAFAAKRETDLVYEGTERLGVLSHELRNLLQTAILSFDVMRQGTVGFGGSTGAMHARSLSGLQVLVERSLAEVRMEADLAPLERLSVVELVEEIEVAAAMEAQGRGLQLTVSTPDADVAIDADRQLLSSALWNLLQNAFKFTHPRSHVSFDVRVADDRVFFEIADECGGLPPGMATALVRPFSRASADRSGLGLGLSIALRAARANQGDLKARDVPGTGCVFTIDLPRKPMLSRGADGVLARSNAGV